MDTKIRKIKVEKPTHPILDRVAAIRSNLVEGLNYAEIPTDPEEFLEYFWAKEISSCQRCMLAETRSIVAKWDGTTKAKIAVILEGPGFLEDRAGIPLVGPIELRGSRCGTCFNVKECYQHRLMYKPFGKAGEPTGKECTPDIRDKSTLPHSFYLRSTGAIVDAILINNWKFSYPRHNWITRYNLLHPDAPWTHESPWFFSNIVLCRSWDKEKNKDMPPSTGAKLSCKPWLVFQLAAVNPELILCLGRESLNSLIGEKPAQSVRPGQFVDSKYGKILYYYHPAHLMRERNKQIKAHNYGKFSRILEQALEYVGLPI
jgi:uracil-DNA glycosylase